MRRNDHQIAEVQDALSLLVWKWEGSTGKALIPLSSSKLTRKKREFANRKNEILEVRIEDLQGTVSKSIERRATYR